jgi:hypothetical protein
VDQEELEGEIRRSMNRLRGKLCGFVEACGLPERQERAIVSTLKNLSYDTEHDILDLLDD